MSVQNQELLEVSGRAVTPNERAAFAAVEKLAAFIHGFYTGESSGWFDKEPGQIDLLQGFLRGRFFREDSTNPESLETLLFYTHEARKTVRRLIADNQLVRRRRREKKEHRLPTLEKESDDNNRSATG